MERKNGLSCYNDENEDKKIIVIVDGQLLNAVNKGFIKKYKI